MPTTTNFGWTTPADTDLVKDGANAIRTLGNGIDTSFIDLKGGTTNQILRKASNTDLDFTWTNLQSGLNLISVTTIGNAVSSVNVTNAFSSTYDNYVIIVYGGALATGLSNLTLQLGATTTGYYFAINGYTYAGSRNDTGLQNTSVFRIGNCSTDTINGYATLLGPNLAKNTVYTSSFAGTSTTNTGQQAAGYLANTTQYTDFTIATDASTMTGGKIYLYGIGM